MVHEVQIVLPQLSLAEIVTLNSPHSRLTSHHSSDQPRTNTTSADRVREPGCVSADHVAIRHQAIVLMTYRDLPGAVQIAIVRQGLDILETWIRGDPVLQQRIQRFVTPLLLYPEPNVHLVFRLGEQPEISPWRFFLVEVNVAVGGLHFHAVAEPRVYPRSWLNIILVNLLLYETLDRKVPAELRTHSRRVDDKARAYLERLVDSRLVCLSFQPDDSSRLGNKPGRLRIADIVNSSL